MTRQTNVDITNLTTYRTYCKADVVYTWDKLEEIHSILKDINSNYSGKKIVILGRGSNTLFVNNEFNGVLILNRTSSFTQNTDGTVTFDSGVLLSTAVQQLQKLGYVGVSHFSIIPGTVGAAFIGNVSLRQSTTFGQIVSAVNTVDYTGGLNTYYEDAFKLETRSSFLKATHTCVLLSVTIKTKSTIPKYESFDIQEYIQSRARRFPHGITCGCWFKPVSVASVPTGLLPLVSSGVIKRDGKSWIIPAGACIEQANCKELRIKGAVVSEKHGNFLLNDGSATGTDLYELSLLVKKRVYERFGVELKEEVDLIF